MGSLPETPTSRIDVDSIARKDAEELTSIRERVATDNSGAIYKPNPFHEGYLGGIDEPLLKSIRSAVAEAQKGHISASTDETLAIDVPEYDAQVFISKTEAKEKTDAPPRVIVEIHGMRQDGSAFNAVNQHLGEYDIYKIDMPGFGKTEALSSEDTHLKTYTDIAEQIIRELGEDRVYAVVGNSMGSVIAANLLERGVEPEKAVLNSLPSGGKGGSKALRNPLGAAFYSAYIGAARKLSPRLHAKYAKKERSIVVDHQLITPKYLESVRKADSKATTDLSEQISRVDYSQINVPEGTQLLMTIGDKDIYADAEDIRKVAEASGADFEVIGHLHENHLDHAGELGETIAKFLDDGEASSAAA